MNVLLIVFELTFITITASSKTITQIKDRPYLLELLNDKKHWCSAVLINPKIVLSVASCTFGIPKKNLTIVPGSSTSCNGYVRQYKVFDVRHRKAYDPSRPGNDIAVIFPQLGIETDKKFVASVILAEMFYMPGTVGVVSSWTLKKTEKGEQFRLYAAKVQVQGPKTCMSDYMKHNITVTSTEICVYDRYHSLSEVEPGGALVVKNRLIGLVSKIYRPMCAQNPGILTSLHYHKEFIKRIVKKVLGSKKFKKKVK